MTKNEMLKAAFEKRAKLHPSEFIAGLVTGLGAGVGASSFVNKPSVQKELKDARLYSNLKGMAMLENAKTRVAAHKNLKKGDGTVLGAMKSGFSRSALKKKDNQMSKTAEEKKWYQKSSNYLAAAATPFLSVAAYKYLKNRKLFSELKRVDKTINDISERKIPFPHYSVHEELLKRQTKLESEAAKTGIPAKTVFVPGAIFAGASSIGAISGKY